MPVNRRSKFRGSRTCGGGTHKNRRGAGNRGGRGHSGGCKHHFIRYYLQGEQYGKHGFNSLASETPEVIDIGQLDQMTAILLERGLASQDGDAIAIDAATLGIGKVLGGGQVTHKLNITAKAFSEQATAKIEAMGGQTLTA